MAYKILGYLTSAACPTSCPSSLPAHSLQPRCPPGSSGAHRAYPTTVWSSLAQTSTPFASLPLQDWLNCS